MKNMKFLSILSVGIIALTMISCENRPIEFPDYEYSTVYFPYQYPVRTIVLGEDIFDNTLDNDHKCKIFATMGGVYANTNVVDIDIEIDNSLCSNLYYGDNTPVQAMPSGYYSLAENQISLDNSLQGGVEVQLTDAFFADSQSIINTFVIPLKMTNVVNADSILSGTPNIANPVRGNDLDWDVLPKDYVLYCVKFINPFHGNYLRRGEDLFNIGTFDSTMVRHEAYVEFDEEVVMTTSSMNSVVFPLTLIDTTNITVTCDLLLTFNDQDQCTVSTTSAGFTASGSGTFVEDGDKNSWGNKDRNVIYLDYTINVDTKTYVTKDTLVVRDRAVSIETFVPTYEII